MAQNLKLEALVERLMAENQELVTSKERMAEEYEDAVRAILNDFESKQSQNDEEHQQEIKTVVLRLESMLKEKEKKFRAEIDQNRKHIKGLQKETEIMKEELDGIKRTVELMNISIATLNRRVQKAEDLESERQAVMTRITNRVDELTDATADTLRLQQRIVKLCRDEASKAMYQAVCQSLAMKFFDAKVVLSNYVEHQFAAESKTAKAGKCPFPISFGK